MAATGGAEAVAAFTTFTCVYSDLPGLSLQSSKERKVHSVWRPRSWAARPGSDGAATTTVSSTDRSRAVGRDRGAMQGMRDIHAPP